MDTNGLAQYADQIYAATIGLMKLVPSDKVDWRPADENNWMTIGQLLAHLPTATGFCMNGFINDEWPEMPEEDMLPSAKNMPSVSSMEEAIDKMQADRKLTAELLAELPEEDFQNQMTTAPWDPRPLPLWSRLLQMVEHQVSHKTTLFTYLKLLGAEVDTRHLYGMV